MRPVDYRAWDTTERKMIYDFSNFAGWQARHEMEDLWKHDRYIKMQFTGLLDNSTPPKKIYEGDIVKYPEYYDKSSQKAHDFSRGMNGVHLYNQPLCI